MLHTNALSILLGGKQKSLPEHALFCAEVKYRLAIGYCIPLAAVHAM